MIDNIVEDKRLFNSHHMKNKSHFAPRKILQFSSSHQTSSKWTRTKNTKQKLLMKSSRIFGTQKSSLLLTFTTFPSLQRRESSMLRKEIWINQKRDKNNSDRIADTYAFWITQFWLLPSSRWKIVRIWDISRWWFGISRWWGLAWYGWKSRWLCQLYWVRDDTAKSLNNHRSIL